MEHSKRKQILDIVVKAVIGILGCLLGTQITL